MVVTKVLPSRKVTLLDMTNACFLQTTGSKNYTNNQLPTFEDKFQIISVFNTHYKANYTPSWINCWDESMRSWLNQHGPGFMYAPCKSHPSRNEYHYIADRDSGKPIMWQMKLQEQNDHPKDINGQPQFPSQCENPLKTYALMLEITKPIHNTGKVVAMDRGFYVPVGIFALHDAGAFEQALKKKRGPFQPKHVPSNQSDEFMKEKPIEAMH